MKYLLDTHGVSPDRVTELCLANHSPANHFTWSEKGRQHAYTRGIMGAGKAVGALAMGNGGAPRTIRNLMDGAAVRWVFPTMRERQLAEIEEATGIPKDRIRPVNHHTAHCWAIVYFLPEQERRTDQLIITSDGVGDRLSATVSRYSTEGVERLSETSYHDSVALFFQHVTGFMGMKECEHEYKVMGLAPYADQRLAREVKAKLRPLFRVDGTNLRCNVYVDRHHAYLEKSLKGARFDAVAAAAQAVVEEVTLEWVSGLIDAHKLDHLALGGGLFMNVKLNKLIREMPQTSSVFVCPSCGDESCAIGSAFYRHCAGRPDSKPPVNSRPAAPSLYLGHSYSEERAERALRDTGAHEHYKITRHEDVEERVAGLIADGAIVARFKGAMEFGARALGNRSILAHPGNFDTVRTINTMIKNRDFWMPFALTMMESRARDYLVMGKDWGSPYMMMTYDTTDLAERELSAGLHPYDRTTRPQILSPEQNPDYHRLLEAFERLTGIGAVLNTSFNLHGEPIVCSPEDALRTFERSGLRYLALDSFLVEKRG